MLIAIAILLAMILYLVDKNGKWRVFWKIIAAVTAVAAVGLGTLRMENKKRAEAVRCAIRIRAAYPGTYDLIASDELVKRAVAKHSDICESENITPEKYEKPLRGKGTKDDPIVIGPDF